MPRVRKNFKANREKGVLARIKAIEARKSEDLGDVPSTMSINETPGSPSDGNIASTLHVSLSSASVGSLASTLSVDVPQVQLSKAKLNALKLARKSHELAKVNKKHLGEKKKLNIAIANAAKKKESIENIQGESIIKRQRGPKKNPKLFADLSREEKCRRSRRIEAISPGIRITTSPPRQPLDAEASVALRVQGTFTKRQMELLRTSTKMVASTYSIRKKEKEIFQNYGTENVILSNDKCTIKGYDFDDVLKSRIRWYGVENLPSTLTVTIVGDFGGDTCKIGFYICDVENPCSEANFSILSSFTDKESYENCAPVFEKLLDSLTAWKQGKFVDGFFIKCKFVITGDLKFISCYLGLQGCSATYFCSFCLLKKREIGSRNYEAPRRTLQQINNDYVQLEEKLATATTASAVTKAHQSCHSVKHRPMTQHFDIPNICPPALHVIAGSVNAILAFAEKKNKEMVNQLLLDAHVLREGHTKKLSGNHGRILLNKLAGGAVIYDGPGFILLLILSDIQQYARAEILNDEEIDEMKKCIKVFAEEIEGPEYNEIVASSQHIHVLISHVVEYVDLHKTWGLTSEQSCEASHKTQNKFFSRIPKRTDNLNERNEYYKRQSILRNKFCAIKR